jgi:transposase-like protein
MMTVNISKLTKLTQKYFNHPVSMASDVRWEVSSDIRMSLPEQALRTTWWFFSFEEAWWAVLVSHRMNVNCMMTEVINRMLDYFR